VATRLEPRLTRTFADASPRSFWLDRADAPDPRPPLEADTTADLVIIGGGFTGLWAAIQAKEEDPSRDVVMLEGEAIAFGASGRNGGFCDASLTHGLPNGIERFPTEIDTIEHMAAESFDGLRETIRRFSIDCDWTSAGVLGVAREPHELDWLTSMVETGRRFGHDARVLDGEATRAEVNSPTYLGSFARTDGSALVDPARLAWGLARAATELGVRIHEGTPATALNADGPGVAVSTPRARVRAHRAILATNAFPPLARQLKRYIVPVYDYVLMTEPLTEAQWSEIGWRNRQGLFDLANQFHYYRRTDDGRILWGGYDAIYHWRGRVDPALERRDATYALLARQFFETFPQLEGLRFSHAWAGAIDTCSRFTVFWGTALGGRAAYAAGYTGLGVGATRFGGRVALDLVSGGRTERTALRFVQKKPVPFPPEPLRWIGIRLTTRALARADRRQGRRGLWLRALDRLGLGFDS
jgi:glycine/D-amino acid oxidase-like deaminating enzyme